MHVVLETVPVKLNGRSHLAHKACKDGLSYGSRALWVSRVEGVQGFLTRFITFFWYLVLLLRVSRNPDMHPSGAIANP